MNDGGATGAGAVVAVGWLESSQAANAAERSTSDHKDEQFLEHTPLLLVIAGRSFGGPPPQGQFDRPQLRRQSGPRFNQGADARDRRPEHFVSAAGRPWIPGRSCAVPWPPLAFGGNSVGMLRIAACPAAAS